MAGCLVGPSNVVVVGGFMKQDLCLRFVRFKYITLLFNINIMNNQHTASGHRSSGGYKRSVLRTRYKELKMDDSKIIPRFVL